MNITALPSAGTQKSAIVRALDHLWRNELPAAESLLSSVLADAPNDPSCLHLLGTVRRLQHRPADAEQLYRRSLAIAASQPRVHRDLGKLLASLKRTDEAIAELREVIRLKSGDADAHFALAAAFARYGNHAAAETNYRDVLRLQPAQLMAQLGLGETLCSLDHPQEAERVLRKGLASGVGDAGIAARFAYRLGIAVKQQNKYSAALAFFDAAQASMPDFPAVDFVRGETLQQLGRWEGAARCFRKLLTRRPDHANAAACLALILAIKRDFAEAREWSTRVLARDRAHPIAAIALAMAEMDAEDFAGAEERLRDLLENPARTGEQGTAFAAGFAADAFDRHGCYREAFGVSRASKAMLRDLWSVQFEAKRMFDVARELAGYFSRAKPWSAAVHPAPSAEAPATHIFVLGFLRSGTTLIETILATNPQVVHADEIDFLNGAAHAFLIASAGLDRLAALDESEIAAWRETYWKAVRDAKFSVGGKIFVDKMPINTFRLPLIARLFPSAKIVFALRDPRDVVLGCFRRHFDPTYYSFEFLRLGDCARFYGATMALADVCREKLPLAILEHRYEDMVADFETSVRALCNFTGLAWSGAMRDFRQAAGAIDLRSASARQVRRGVYPDAVGHWRHYREQLAPVLPILAPWGARFGYPAE